MIELEASGALTTDFKAKIDIEIKVGRFLIKTISSGQELQQAFRLRYQVFQVEMIGHQISGGLDHDAFDAKADHLAVYDTKSREMVATCRLNSSLFTESFYSEQEFNLGALLKTAGTKLELGRVCVHREFRKGIIIMLLWRALAEYMTKTETKTLFGCGSVMTEDPAEALLLYKYLIEEQKTRLDFGIQPSEKYRSAEFDRLLASDTRKMSEEGRARAKDLLPSLCRSYFDIGCYVPGPPAFDHDFKCIDFLTILECDNLDPRVRQKMMGSY